MQELLFASSNSSKLQDISSVFTKFHINIVQPTTAVPEVDETANTYAGNAILKAEFFGEWSGKPCLTDDSGIEIQALNGEPGVLSARFAGINSTSQEKNSEVLRLLAKVKNRSARMVSVLCLRLSKCEYLICEGEILGTITHETRGLKGWGYEPLFQVKDSQYTLAELREHSTSIVNHRTNAATKLAQLITAYCLKTS